MKNKIFAIVLLIVLCLTSNVYASNKVKVTLDSCVDGDTASFVVKNKKKKVRFLGINTPESVKKDSEVESYGKEASNYTCKKLKNAKNIELEYDPKSDKKDKYGRVLAWVFVDGKLLQKDLVSKGYAKVAYLYDDYLYTDEIKKAEEIAKSKGLRVWSTEEQISEEIMDSVESFFDKIKRKIAKFLKNVL